MFGVQDGGSRTRCGLQDQSIRKGDFVPQNQVQRVLDRDGSVGDHFPCGLIANQQAKIFDG